MKRFILVVFCLLAFPVMASHIVGGEFEIVHVSGSLYRVNLILYFDKINGNAQARDASATARIFRKSDNAFMADVFLPLTTQSDVSYTQPACSNGELQTERLVYSTTMTFLASAYNDPEGYYIVWERCCRNYTITNIISQQPPQGAIYYANAAGQTFYLEFPPVVKNGQPFINSTPRLFPPLNDYACPSRAYYADFAGSDDDGDSLVYSLSEPLNTHTAEAVPATGPQSAPYPTVRWQTGFSMSNIMKGNPDLRISPEGLLTVKPTIQGLFVFAVKCEEFRDGVKIGEVRRDFQMLVVDRCPMAEAPVIVGKTKTGSYSLPDQPMTVTFANTVSDADRCITVRITDADAFKPEELYRENVTIKAIPIGFKKNVSGILPSITTATLTPAQPSVEFSVCFESCPLQNGPFQVGIVAFDDACSLPLFDTLKVTVNIEPPVNHPPQFTTADVNASVTEGTIHSWSITGIDPDGDNLTIGVLTDGFNLADYGMTITQIKNTNGSYEGRLDWDTRCDLRDFSQRTQFQIKINLDDQDLCNVQDPDIMILKLNVLLPDNGPPIIYSSLSPDRTVRFINDVTRKINESLVFDVFGHDDDVPADHLQLKVNPLGFTLAEHGITFPEASGDGDVSSRFQWDIRCTNVDLSKKSDFVFDFVVMDKANKCRIYQADTLTVRVKVLPPDNHIPVLSVASLNSAVPLSGDALTATLGQQIALGLTGYDADTAPAADNLVLELIAAEGNNVPPAGYVFADATGKGTVTSTFTWLPQCNIFRNGVYENQYTFKFRVYDDRCFSASGDTLTVDMTIRDVDDKRDEFLPPNFISPNGDGRNDFFAMVKWDESTGELRSILPEDNCAAKFENIVIYNRWGRSVFESSVRDFRWYASQEATGVYYYTLRYSDREYKGLITVAGEGSHHR